jgi:ComF family protein
VKLARRVVDHVLDFCYPARCASCEAACRSALLCPTCEQSQRNLEEHPACDRCAKPLTEWLAPCPYCMGKGIHPFDRIVALGVFDDPLKELIHRMKYQKRWSVGEELAHRLLELDRVKALLSTTEKIVAVPLHRWHQFKRGYNQSEVIANHLRARCGLPIKLAHPIRRTRATHTQTDIHSRAKRIENVRGAFRLTRPAQIRGKHVVLIDDVTTTGATLQAVGRELMKAEPASLNAIVLAVADPRKRGFEAI